MFSTKRCLTLVALAAFGAIATAQVTQDKAGGPFGSADGKIVPKGDKVTKIDWPFDSADGKIAPRLGKGTKSGMVNDSVTDAGGPFDPADGKIAPKGGRFTKLDGPFDSADGKIAPRLGKGTKSGMVNDSVTDAGGPFDPADGKIAPKGGKFTKLDGPFDSADGKIAPRLGKGTKSGMVNDSVTDAGGPFDPADGKIAPKGGKFTKLDGPFDSADGKIAPRLGKGTKSGMVNDSVTDAGGPFDPADGKIAPKGGKFTKLDGPFDSADGKIAPRLGKGTKSGMVNDSVTDAGGPFDPADGKIILAGEIGYPVCFGDETGMPCPFKNPGMAGRGCENSLGLGGGLFYADGVARVSEDSVSFRVDFLPHATTIFFLQGTGCRNDELGLPFGDGLMCMGGSVIRLGVVSTQRGRAVFPPLASPNCYASISMLGMLPPGGGERYYQALYRDNYALGKKTGFNLTNAWSMTWAP